MADSQQYKEIQIIYKTFIYSYNQFSEWVCLLRRYSTNNVYNVLFQSSLSWQSGLVDKALGYGAADWGSIPFKYTVFYSRKWTFYVQIYFNTYKDNNFYSNIHIFLDMHLRKWLFLDWSRDAKHLTYTLFLRTSKIRLRLRCS